MVASSPGWRDDGCTGPSSAHGAVGLRALAALADQLGAAERDLGRQSTHNQVRQERERRIERLGPQADVVAHDAASMMVDAVQVLGDLGGHEPRLGAVDAGLHDLGLGGEGGHRVPHHHLGDAADEDRGHVRHLRVEREEEASVRIGQPLPDLPAVDADHHVVNVGLGADVGAVDLLGGDDIETAGVEKDPDGAHDDSCSRFARQLDR